MDFSSGGKSSKDSKEIQRQTAAEIARKKVLAAFSTQPEDGGLVEVSSEDVLAKTPMDDNLDEPTRSKHSENLTKTSLVEDKVQIDNKAGQFRNDTRPSNYENFSHLKDEQLTAGKINSESWRRYHSAWQDYYQKYYSEYYSNAARNYIAKEKLKEARKEADEEDILSGIPKLSSDWQKEINSGLRAKIKSRATDNAKKTRRFRKFMPIIAGVTVMLTVLFLQYNRLIFAPIMAYVSPGNAPASEIEALDPTITQTVSADPRLIIPKLNIDVPVHFGIPVSSVMDAMMNGVAHYRINGASAFPGEVGNFVITGHSAGDIYSSNPYKFIFSGLERLEDGDLIYVNYESTRYTYQVYKKEVVEPSNVAALTRPTSEPIITLVTCTPLGTSRYRLLVTGRQISPSTETASAPEAGEEGDSAEEVMPANEPSFFEQIWNWLTGR
ncbi:MAG: sortase [Candidatus Saccharibacteria bacterium]|nr:sortase [Candidatus Saccharibacteria bacterium]